MGREFAKSEFGTLGVEFEVDVIDRVTSAPLPIASVLAAEVQPALARGRVSPDLFASTLELTTGICSSIHDVAYDLQAASSGLAPSLIKHNAALLGMGLHPFAQSSSAVAADGARYQEIMDLIAWPARQVTTNSIQVHVGMPSGNHAVASARALRSVLPFVLALSASSPFRDGATTGLASTRAALFASVPRSGPQPEFESWNAYADYCAVMIQSQSMPTNLHVWWDCRIQPELGTLEIRIADSVADFDDVLAIVSLAWCVAVGTDALSTFMLPNIFSDENRWRAIRYGTACRMISDDSGTTQPLATLMQRLLDALDATADILGCRKEIEGCLRMSNGESTHQQLTQNNGSQSELDLSHLATQSMRVNW